MNLEVSAIHFLASGALSVEVLANAKKDPPTVPAIDNARYRIYVPANQVSDSIADIKELALKLALQPISAQPPG